MFGLRAKQLERQLFNYINTLSSEQERNFAKNIYNYCFAGLNRNIGEQAESFLQSLYNDINRDPELRDIFSRSLAKLAMETPDSYTLNKLFGLIIFFYHLVNEFVDAQGQRFKDENYRKFKDFLQSGKKPMNHQIKTIEQMVDYIIDSANDQISKLIEIENWNQLIDFIFGTPDYIDTIKEPNKLEAENIKTLLIELGLKGPLIDSILEKYMGLVNFGMSLLTLLGGSPFEKEFKDEVNNILSELGTSRRIIIVQKNLRELHLQIREIHNDIESIFSQIVQAKQRFGLNIESEDILNLAAIITREPEFNANKANSGTYNMRANDIEKEYLPDLHDIPEYHRIFSISSFSTLNENLRQSRSKLNELFQEIYKNLEIIGGFMDSLIRKANDIVSKLLQKQFRGTLPLNDVKIMERAGIDIGAIISSSRPGSEVTVPDLLIKQKNAYTQKLLEFWDNLQVYLKQKVKEEDVITGIPDRLRIFRNILTSLTQLLDEIQQKNLFGRYKEKTPLMLAYLMAAVPLLKQMENAITSMKKIPYNKNNIPQFMDTIESLAQSLDIFEIITAIILTLNEVLDIIGHLDRAWLYKVSFNPEYLRNYSLLEGLIPEILKVIKRKYNQKLISREDKVVLENLTKDLSEKIGAIKRFYGIYTEQLANRLESVRDMVQIK